MPNPSEYLYIRLKLPEAQMLHRITDLLDATKTECVHWAIKCLAEKLKIEEVS